MTDTFDSTRTMPSQPKEDAVASDHAGDDPGEQLDAEPDSPSGAAEHRPRYRSGALVTPDETNPDRFPRMFNLSAAGLYAGVIRPVDPAPSEFVTLRMPRRSLEMAGAIGSWNLLWEAAQFRRRFFDLDDLPKPMSAIADLGDNNIIFVPRTRSRYFEYAPLLHLLPRRILDRFGLPLIGAGQWPFLADYNQIDDVLPADFAERLTRAWAWTVWRDLNSGSPMNAFTPDDPIRLLAHNLDFWLPAVTDTIQTRLRDFPEVANGKPVGPVTLEDGSVLPGAVTGNPRMGGEIWFGEHDARNALTETVLAADRTGRLQALIDAVRSNRVEDDFSDRWSPAREDFERKLYAKRRKTGGVRFVELTDTITVQSPDSDITDNLITNDFLALLDTRNRQIVVLLSSGVTSHTEIAGILGYANHSAVTKRLTRIRRQAEEFFAHS